MYKRTSQSLEHYIGFGRYQFFHAFVIQGIIFLEVVNMTMMGYAGTTPKISCLSPDNNGSDSLELEWVDNSSPEGERHLCGLIANGSCLNYTETFTFYSVVQEWGLTCDRTHLKYIIMSVQMVGVLIGAPSAGQISDLVGRRMTVGIFLICMIFLGGSSILARSWLTFAMFRFLVGFFVGGAITTTYVFLIEFLKKKHRLWVTAVINWPIGFMYMGLMGWLTGEWRAFTLYTNALGLLILPFFWFTKESPRWLIQRGHAGKAAEVLRELASWNSLAYDSVEIGHLIEKERGNGRRRNYTHCHLCMTGEMGKHSVVLALAWFTVSMISYAVVLNMGQLYGNMYVNTVIYGCTRLVLNLLILTLDVSQKWLGRKLIHTAAEILIVACSVSGVILQVLEVPVWQEASRWLSLAAVVLTGPLWLVVALMAAELYPTPVRNLAHSFGSACARLGSVLAPQVLFLSHLWAPGPFVVFGVLGILDCILFLLLLPETKGLPLPESMPSSQGCCGCCGGGVEEELDLPFSPIEKKPRKERRDWREERSRSGTQRSESFAMYRFHSVSNEQL